MPTKQDFENQEREGHIWRSQMLDQFAKIEAWVTSMASGLGVKPTKASLGQKIKAVRTASAAFRKPTRINDLTDRVDAAIALRNDVVHSILETALYHDGSAIWLFRNVARDARENSQSLTVLTAEEFKRKICDLKKLVKELNDQSLIPQAPAARAASSATASTH